MKNENVDTRRKPSFKRNDVKLTFYLIGLICERRKNRLTAPASHLICAVSNNFISTSHTSLINSSTNQKEKPS